MTAPASEGVLLLAAELEAGGQWPGAARCYEAVLKVGRQLPQAEATTRLRLALLLLQHTHNVHEARDHLERAVRCCRKHEHAGHRMHTMLMRMHRYMQRA
jgi:Cohesin loading factor